MKRKKIDLNVNPVLWALIKIVGKKDWKVRKVYKKLKMLKNCWKKQFQKSKNVEKKSEK